MNAKEAKERLSKFMGNDVFTFTIKIYPEQRWVAQCNEVDGIITSGTGYDHDEMDVLMRDAILTAAGIPSEHADIVLKRMWGHDVRSSVEAEQDVDVKAFPSTYTLKYAGVGQV